MDGSSLVVELASNDGYLLKNYVQDGIPVLGIDPAPGPVEVAQQARRRDAACILHRGTGRGTREFGPPGRHPARQQRAGPRRRHQRLRGGHRDGAEGRWRRGDRVPVRARPRRPLRVRHDLPPAPVLLLGDGARRAVPAARPRARGRRARLRSTAVRCVSSSRRQGAHGRGRAGDPRRRARAGSRRPGVLSRVSPSACGRCARGCATWSVA